MSSRLASARAAGAGAGHHFAGIDALAPLAESSSKAAPSWTEDAAFGADAAHGAGGGGALSWERVAGGQLVVGGMAAEDINQGALGDCYFLASVAALAERSRPTLERAVLKAPSPGVYGVRWFVSGRPTTTWIDDRFPLRDGRPVFSHSASGELWVLVLEKCYAKEFGGYRAIEAGRPVDALADLTGLPATSHPVGFASGIYDVIAEHAGETKIMCAAVQKSPLLRAVTFGLSDVAAWLVGAALALVAYAVKRLFGESGEVLVSHVEAAFSWLLAALHCLASAADFAACGAFSMLHVALCEFSTGLVPGHAYSVLEVCAVPILCLPQSATKTLASTVLAVKFVKLRNPWGRISWRGAYSARSVLWRLRPGLAEALDYKPNAEASDGSFWMELGSFKLYFDAVDVLHMDAGWLQFRAEGRLTARRAALSFSVSAACRCRIAVYQRRPADARARFGWRVSVLNGGDVAGAAVLFPARTSQAECDARPYSLDLSITTPELELAPGQNYQLFIEGYPPSSGMLPLPFAVLGSVSEGKLLWGNML